MNRKDELEWEFREEELAADFLSQALDALMKCASPTALYRRRTKAEVAELKPREILLDMIGASKKRLEYARTAILFTTLAAEAIVNEFIFIEGKRTGLSEPDIQAIDKMSTPDKYVLGVQLVSGAALFDRASGPGQAIGALFKLRRHLVHPKRRLVKVKKSNLFDQAGYDDFNPDAAARFIVAVAEAGEILAKASARPDSDYSFPSSIASRRQAIRELGEMAHENLPSRSGHRVGGSAKSKAPRAQASAGPATSKESRSR